ncbi:uncharacterized protein CC84DRAFT_1159879 [Paraphaeosphaeria sporulosa]|uniref:Uncharacterized protein n=1 Tax=Paraphaeosphaeria sporulosa TaxID=1460663 RepID=A0A177D0C7_9PLEO|nr:uncharacterized protein CC84DRAFT_1159879 [Paraphaeosphaeria sporulosa]OAG12590.1 hypothetical protein CC84DRAFT_1159879 [Paraphaeosphaeria sporulosa]
MAWHGSISLPAAIQTVGSVCVPDLYQSSRHALASTPQMPDVDYLSPLGSSTWKPKVSLSWCRIARERLSRCR